MTDEELQAIHEQLDNADNHCTYSAQLAISNGMKLLAEVQRLRDELRMLDAAKENIVKAARESDWCPACEHHPSSGHASNCPINGVAYSD